MWQRIQTLYLLLAGASATLLLVLSMLSVVSGIDGVTYFANFTGVINEGWSSIYYFQLVTFVLTVLSVLLSFVTIFLFKHRKLQIRLTTFSLLLIVAAIVYFAYFVYSQREAMQAELQIKPWLFLPIVTLLCQILAIRNIIKDDILVRSTNRLR